RPWQGHQRPRLPSFTGRRGPTGQPTRLPMVCRCRDGASQYPRAGPPRGYGRPFDLFFKGESLMRSATFVRRPCRAAILSAAVAAVSFAGAAGADDHVCTSREHGQFSDPSNWLGGNVPTSGADTFLTFTNLGHSSYRAFNDLGILNVGGITLETRTGTATFISVSAGSAYQFGDGSFIRSADTGLFRFGGISGVPNDWRLVGNLTLDTQSYGNTYVA